MSGSSPSAFLVRRVQRTLRDQVSQHGGRDFAQRADNGSGGGQVVAGSAGAQQSDAGHARRVGRRHAGRRILDYRTPCRRHVQALGRQQEDLRIGLAPANVLSGDDGSQ